MRDGAAAAGGRPGTASDRMEESMGAEPAGPEPPAPAETGHGAGTASAQAAGGGAGAGADAAPATGAADPAGVLTDRGLASARRSAYGALAVMVLQIPLWTVALAWTLYLDGSMREIPGLFAVLAAAVVLAVALAAVAALLLRLRVAGSVRYRAALVWGGNALALTLLFLLGPNLNTAIALGTWWAAVSVVPPRRHVLLTTPLLVALPVVHALLVDRFDAVQFAVIGGFAVLICAIFRLIDLGMLQLLEIAREAIAGREARARLAVSEERLRFARDMHDLLGHSLSGIAVKSELAGRLVRRAPERAEAEMAGVQDAAREALREVRAAVSGYRRIDLAEELRSVCEVLSASGAACEVSGGPEEVPEDLRDLVAWLVREAGTNVIRHSAAARCRIVLRRDGGAVVAEVYNDGAAGAAGAAPGNGLTGLAERVAAAGGTLSAAPSGADGFLLRAVLPARRGIRTEPEDRQGANT
ncbi:sensor histidine kinase [Nocardiopsis composta]|uniref:Two-component system sensor histidine kinase DesK n=1 Tax=Nocardiopsis composta TaxID=157465 RepID=A0A7W8QPM2_9ACTN|nr:histidine kinase [Nocardiopsis composta]MBB5434323.1 two-component system sensor histidine kinase DesK [Nocardiopsis composta]